MERQPRDRPLIERYEDDEYDPKRVIKINLTPGLAFHYSYLVVEQASFYRLDAALRARTLHHAIL